MDPARQLEWELSLSSTELISHGWYRGSMGRPAAELELPEDGNFLVRDSASQPGNYVLSCRHAGQYLHFVINRVVIQPDTVYERFQYQFEDEPYDTVPDLITSYVGSGKPISMASGARIQRPANRTYPLTSYHMYNSMSRSGSRPLDLCKELTTFSSKYNSLDRTHRCVPHHEINYSNEDSKLHHQNQNIEASVAVLSISGDANFHSLRRKVGEADQENNVNQSKSSEQSSWDGWEGVQVNPPAKPARVQQPPYQTSGSDSGNGSGDSHSSGPGDALSQHSNNSRPIHDPFKPQIHFKFAEENVMKIASIEYNQVSNINVDSFRSVLFASNNNKPLESDALQLIKTLLRTSGPRILANHLTTMDIRLFFSDNKNEENSNPLDTVTGLELCLLPHGNRMRLDVIERVECMKLLIAVTILTCQTDIERADVFHDWVQLAIEVKTALGNLFGFSVIMLGLSMPQIESLQAMWYKLRQKYTDAAFTFEAKLRPCLKNMNDGTDPAPPNTTIPHLLPTILHLHNADLMMERGKIEFDTSSSNSMDYGLGALASHMEMARKFPEQIPMFRQNARSVVQELSSLGTMYDPNLLELFQTEFHIRFLWGSKGSAVSAQERHSRLSQVLTAMSQKYPSQVTD